MKGPGYKITGDVRRTWRCSKCGLERKHSGEVTAMQCTCQGQPWMQLVLDLTNVPRPIQRPSDVERHPIDFGIEPPPPAASKPEATIIKSAISLEIETIIEELPMPAQPPAPDPANERSTDDASDDWGEGIL